jgi:hypothetical protein
MCMWGGAPSHISVRLFFHRKHRNDGSRLELTSPKGLQKEGASLRFCLEALFLCLGFLEAQRTTWVYVYPGTAGVITAHSTLAAPDRHLNASPFFASQAFLSHCPFPSSFCLGRGALKYSIHT